MNNKAHQLGSELENTKHSSTFIQSSISNVEYIDCYNEACIAITQNKLYMWGSVSNAQRTSHLHYPTPTEIISNKFTKVFKKFNHYVVLTDAVLFSSKVDGNVHDFIEIDFPYNISYY